MLFRSVMKMIWLIIGAPLIILVIAALYLERKKGMIPPDPTVPRHGVESDLAKYSQYPTPHSDGSGENTPQG